MIHIPKYVFKYVFLLLLLSFHLFLLFNLQFTAWPEMLSYAYLRNNDFLLYKDMIHPYPPVLTMALSLVYKIFGYHLLVLQTVAWSLILVSDVLIFLIVKTLTRRSDIALLGLAAYVLLQPFLEGNMLWFDIAIIPPVLIATLFALKKKIFLAGLFLAIAALIKQTAVIFLFFLFFFMLFKRGGLRNIALLSVGPLILVVPLIIRLLQEGALLDFFHWTVLYPLTEWGRYPGYVQMSITTREVLVLFLLFLPLLTGISINIVRRKLLLDNNIFLLLLFLIGSLIAIYPRFSFFHFQAALAFLVVTTVYVLCEWETKKLAICIAVFFGVLFPIIHAPVVARDWQKEAQFYGRNDLRLAEKIADLTDTSSRVFLLGPHSGLYVMANRLPPKRWSDNFAWYLEIPGVQEEIISRWEENPPYYVVRRMPEEGSWFDLGTYQPKKIATWIEANYTKEKEVEPGVWLWRLVPRRNDEG